LKNNIKDLFLSILSEGRNLDASDIHLGPENHIGFRSGGKLIKSKKFDKISEELSKELSEITLSFLSDSSRKKSIKEINENGHAGFAITIEDSFRYRVNSGVLDNGAYTVLRMLTTKPAHLENLGFSQEINNALISLSMRKSGLFLVVGPTGSGKSTTLAAIIREINNTRMNNIITLEDPIEYTHQELKSNIIQKEVGRDVPSFFEGLRAALREDPDVILIGEIRDEETLNLALKAAETGHLVLSTLHTDNTVSTIQRIISMSDNEMLTRDRLSTSLVGVIAQRLEPVTEVNEGTANVLNINPRKQGRIINYEMLTFTSALSSILKSGNGDLQIAGMLDNTPLSQSYNQTLVSYVKNKKITREEALKLSSNIEDMNSRLDSI
jgi:twitching motility protein PilT